MPRNLLIAKSVTERDKKIMRFIGIDGLAPLRQLHRLFWQETKEKTCLERLLQLEKAGWLQGHYVDVRKRGERVFALTPLGARLHFSQGERKRMMIGLPAHHEIKQQLMAQEARLCLQQLLANRGARLEGWLNERELRSEARRSSYPGRRAFGGLLEVADACAIIAEGNGNTYRLPVEIDGKYYGRMLQAKIAGLVRTGQPALWVTTTDRALRIKSEVTAQGGDNIEIMVLDQQGQLGQ